MGLAPTHSQLEGLTDDELVERYNALASSTVVGTQFYLDEIVRRRMAKESLRMLSLTETMARLTWVMLALTIINVVVAAIPLFR
jgi:hypothetical protein